MSGNGEAHAVVLLSRTVICLIAFDPPNGLGAVGCQVVRLLILAGVDVNLTGRYGRTPLQLVAQPFEKT